MYGRPGGTQVQRGAAPVRDFVKEGYFFVSMYEVWGGGGGDNPLAHASDRIISPSADIWAYMVYSYEM